MAPPLCGRGARGKPWRGRRSGALLPPLSSLSTGGLCLDRLTFHDSNRTWPRRSPGNGGKPSQPQPEPKQGRPPSGGKARGGGGRAADEAAARRKLRACPLADAKAAGFVKRPQVSTGLRARRNHRPDTGPSGPGPARRRAGLRSFAPPPAEKALRRRTCRAGPGFPGSCETGDPGFRSGTARRNPRLRPRIPPSPEPKLRPRDRDGGKRDVSSEPPNGEPPGLRPWSGSPRGNRLRLRPEKDPGGRGAANPRFKAPSLETAQRGTPRLPG